MFSESLGTFAAGRTGDAAGVVGALGRVVRLCDFASARLAHDDLPALLRRRRRVFGVWHGADAAGAAAIDFQAAGHHYDAAHRRDVQSDAGDGVNRWVRLRDGIFHCLV